VLAGFFDGISDNWVHGLVLWAAAAVVGWEAGRERRGTASPDQPLLPHRGPGSRSRGERVVLVGAALLFAGTVSSWHLYTWPITGAVVAVALAGLAVGWRGPLTAPVRAPVLDRVGTGLWVAVAVAAGLWELFALSQQPSLTLGSYDHPTVSVLMDSVLSTHLGRALALLAWLGLGWFLLGTTPLAAGSRSRMSRRRVVDDVA
jgi:hypothetical protein